MTDPPDDVTTFLLPSEIDGEPLTDQEIVTQLQFMVMAGVHTTRTLLTHLVHRLLEFPDLFAAVQQDRELVAPLIEESLRHDSPVPATSRRLTADTEVGGCPMHKGEWIEVGVMSANHDDAVYPDADAFLLDRPDARDHLGFGTGPHVCPGATLARLEARTAVNVLLDGLAGMRPVEGAEYPPLPSMLDHRPIPAHLVPTHLRAGEEPCFRNLGHSLTRSVRVPMGGYVRNGWGLVSTPREVVISAEDRAAARRPELDQHQVRGRRRVRGSDGDRPDRDGRRGRAVPRPPQLGARRWRRPASRSCSLLPFVVVLVTVSSRDGLDQAAGNFARERMMGAEAERREFATRLGNALEMADTEVDVLDVLERTLHRVGARPVDRAAARRQQSLAPRAHARRQPRRLCAGVPGRGAAPVRRGARLAHDGVRRQ